MSSVSTVLGVAVAVSTVLALGGSLWLVRRLEGDREGWRRTLADRFVMGVPWGTLVTVAFLFAVYLFVQGGLTSWADPLTVPFRAWSFLYPVGILTAPFSHSGPNHLLGNVFSTLALGPIAEYAWGHYPPDDASADGRPGDGGLLDRTLGRPWIRALVLFPAGVGTVAVATGAFALGPGIGFSGVAFALAGFALVHYPITTVLAVLGGSEVMSVVLRALTEPVVTATPRAGPPAPPWWAEIAIQAHGIGLLMGVVLGGIVLGRRGRRPDPLRVWLAVVIFGVTRGLWAVYWVDEGAYVLYRGVGVLVLVAVAALVTVGASAPDRTLAFDLTGRDVGLGVLAVVLAALVGPALFANVVTPAATAGQPPGSVQVNDYTVFYGEGVETELSPVAGPVDGTTTARASGVFVVSQRRGVRTRQVTRSELAFGGSASIEVGGIGWRRRITAVRRGWSVVGNGSTYLVYLNVSGRDGRTLSYASGPVRAGPRIDDRAVTVFSEDGSFHLRVTATGNGTVLGRARVPEPGRSVVAGGLEFVRQDGRVYARRGGTRVRIATAETRDSTTGSDGDGSPG